MTIRLHHVTTEDAERDAHRNLLLMAQQYERNATDLARQVDSLALALVTRDNTIEDQRRKIARLEAENARLTRQGPHWWEWTLAWLVCRLEALDRWTRAWWM